MSSLISDTKLGAEDAASVCVCVCVCAYTHTHTHTDTSEGVRLVGFDDIPEVPNEGNGSAQQPQGEVHEYVEREAKEEGYEPLVSSH